MGDLILHVDHCDPDDEDLVMCCMGGAVYGRRGCTCWEVAETVVEPDAREGLPCHDCERVLLCDAGLWGEVWSEVVRDAPGLAARLIAWEGRDPSELWRSLAMAPRPEDPQERAAAYLWLQGRAATIWRGRSLLCR